MDSVKMWVEYKTMLCSSSFEFDRKPWNNGSFYNDNLIPNFKYFLGHSMLQLIVDKTNMYETSLLFQKSKRYSKQQKCCLTYKEENNFILCLNHANHSKNKNYWIIVLAKWWKIIYLIFFFKKLILYTIMQS